MTLIASLWLQKEWFPDLLDLLAEHDAAFHLAPDPRSGFARVRGGRGLVPAGDVFATLAGGVELFAVVVPEGDGVALDGGREHLMGHLRVRLGVRGERTNWSWGLDGSLVGPEDDEPVHDGGNVLRKQQGPHVNPN